MEFLNAKIKAINANIGNGLITISFSLHLDEDNLETAQELAQYDDEDRGSVDVIVNPHQLPLKLSNADWSVSKDQSQPAARPEPDAGGRA